MWCMASHPSYEQSKQVAEASRETEWTKPSFGKELFLGNFRLDLIHPQPELDPAAVEKGRAFLERLRVFLTGRGRALEEPVVRCWERAEQTVLAGINARDRLTIRRLLDRVKSNLDSGFGARQ